MVKDWDLFWNYQKQNDINSEKIENAIFSDNKGIAITLSLLPENGQETSLQ